MLSYENKFYDAKFFVDGENRSITYRTGMAVYEEVFIGKMLVSGGWNGAGYVPHMTVPNVTRMNHKVFAEPSSFSLNINGQLLHSHWEFENFETEETEKGLIVKVTMKNTIMPVRVKLFTLLDGTPILTRWLEITNLSEASQAMSSLAIMSGGLHYTKRHKSHLRNGSQVYKLGFMNTDNWGCEGNFTWHDLTNGGFYFGGRFIRERYRHPMFVLENNATGECFIGQMAYSGGYKFDFDLKDVQDDAHISFKASLDGYAPLRVIEKGETITTPEMHMGMMFGGLDECVNAMNSHIRKSVMKFKHPLPTTREACTGPGVDMSQEAVLRLIDAAAKRKDDVFFIDAGWYTPDKMENEWYLYTGDWFEKECRYEMGIEGIRDYCHEKGLKFGLWLEPERIGGRAKALETQQANFCMGYDDEVEEWNGGAMLDMSKPEAAKLAEETITKLIEKYKIDFYRTDFNVRALSSFSYNKKDGYLENADLRYYENWYALYEKLKKRFPNVIFETCASGGGRTDLGMVSRCDHTWITDWQIPPREFMTINGATMCLPPELCDRLIGGMDVHTVAEYDYHSRMLLFGRPTMGMITPPSYVENPIQVERFNHVMSIYNDIVRPMHAKGSKVYHHTPVVDGIDPKGTGILEYAAQDNSCSMMGIFQLSDPDVEEITVCFRGLDISKDYRLYMDNSGKERIVSGYDLSNNGVKIRLETALTTELLIAQEV
jgi:alpha-galactosidase